MHSGEAAIAQVRLTLLDAAGNPTGLTTSTDATGYYCFTELPPGTYGVTETQPAGYHDGLDMAGDGRSSDTESGALPPESPSGNGISCGVLPTVLPNSPVSECER